LSFTILHAPATHTGLHQSTEHTTTSPCCRFLNVTKTDVRKSCETAAVT